mgnify:CR=1 FL=1
MIQTGFESKVKIQQIIDNQLPDFVLSESPNTVDFLKQYYISQEYQGGPVDITDNLDQYLNLNNLTPNVVVDSTTLSVGISSDAQTIEVSTTKGFPNEYGLLKIGSEVITYTGLTTNTFTGCIRGFCGITSYHQELNKGDLVFSDTTAESHNADASIQNLSSLFLKEFYKKQKSTLTPGLEDVPFAPDVNAGNFIKEARSLYESKGTDESFRILFNVLYGETPKVINLEDYLLKPSAADYVRREIVIADLISGDPSKLVGQTIFKESDLSTNASISEVEPFTRVGVALTENKQYYKISLFMGYDESASTIQGNFSITPASKVLENVSIGASTIPVDSTVGFGATGTIISGVNTTINYTSKSINQFFGCTGIGASIQTADVIRNDDIYFGYEDGNSEGTKVQLRLTGVLSEFDQISKNITIDEGQIISVSNIGDLIENPATNKTHKEIFANSWIYNTSVRYKLASINNASCITTGNIDKSSLKLDDKVEIVESNSNNVVFGGDGNLKINSIDEKDITLSVNTFLQSGVGNYDIRRRINTAFSTLVPLKDGRILSDTQNLYVGSGNTAYIASNSLPSGRSGLVTGYYINNIGVDIQSVVATGLTNKNLLTNNYQTLQFNNNLKFIDGDKVYYEPESWQTPYIGLDTGSYYVGIGTTTKEMKLYSSRSFVDGTNFIELNIPSDSTGIDTGGHRFTLDSQKENIIGPQKLLKKFSLESNINRGEQVKTAPGSIGMLIDGVEITNYKSTDIIYYGPLKNVNILNTGSGYDVINPPKIDIAPGIGITALVQPVISGTITNIDVDPQGFDIEQVVSIGVTGGNGNAVLNPLIIKKSRDVNFDGRATTNSGGINTTTNQLTFLKDHKFKNNQQVIYKSNGNNGIGLGIGVSSLVNSSSYFVNVIDNDTIQLYPSLNDSITGVNTVGFGTTSLAGIHKFSTLPNQNSIVGVEVVNGGTFTNRKLIVKPSGISTAYNTVNFENHGFESGEIIEYSTTGTQISGLTTTNQYQINKINDNSFKLSDAGIGGTIRSNYTMKNYVSLGSTGSGYHNFAYPDIIVSLDYAPVGFGTTTQSVETVILTPTVRGSLIGAYLYETGTGYGSSILNFENKPIISIKTGKNAQLEPIIVNGLIDTVNLQYGGEEYYSIPDLNVIDSSGKGSGASLRPIIVNNRIASVEVINPGIGYSSVETSINVVSAGKNAFIDPNVRPLSIDISKKYKSSELLLNSNNQLSYSVSGYNQNYIDSFDEDPTEASGIIGWAYDGNPIYGPYGYPDPTTASSVKKLDPGYEIDISNVFDRPSTTTFEAGFFVEDYKFTNSGDLDRNNGRFGKTPEFPDGIYAYFATVDDSVAPIVPKFPYFVGDSYRSVPLNQNLDQSFDFSSSDLIRNTFPYRVSDKDTDNDFIIETNEISRQKAIIESVTSGPIDQLVVISPGDNYKINDSLIFDNVDTNGGGLISKVSSLKGKDVVNVSTASSSYSDVIFTWVDSENVKVNILPSHSWENNDNIIVSGLSTQLSQLNGSTIVGLTTSMASLTYPLGSVSSIVGVSTEIWISRIPENVSIGSSIKIGNETLKLLEVYRSNNLIRVERGAIGVSHTATSTVSFVPNSFNIKKSVNAFDSTVNNKVFFNPKQSIGFGTISGISSSMTFDFANVNITRDVLTQQIYIENHPFTNNQQVSYSAGTSGNIAISSSPTSAPFTLPSIVYVSPKTPHTLGIKTGIGTEFSDVYFRSGGDDYDNYSFETNYSQIIGNVERIATTVSLSTSHTLKRGDTINLNIKPNLSVGIGTSTAVVLQRQNDTGYILVNPIGFNSTGINTITNELTLSSHGLKTGDKIAYSADLFPSGISSQSYYVYKVDENTIQLSSTSVEVESNPPVVIGFGSTGGVDQIISQVNPQLSVIKTNNLVFDLSDSSLEDYKFKLYYDNDFENEFVSTASTIFDVVNVGTVGISTTATSTINYSTALPQKLYYNLQKSGFISTADTDSPNYCEIDFSDSPYNSSYNIIGVSDTTFEISLSQVPEKLSYDDSECSSLDYTTTSLTARGGINNVNILSGGINYKKLPNFVGSSSTEGTGGSVVAKSAKVGNSNKVRIINEGFEYSSDKTLQPSAYISPLVIIENSNTIGVITVTSGGNDYISAPLIKMVNPTSREVIQSGLLEAELINTTISNVTPTVLPSGLPNGGVELFATQNTNGVSISTIASNSTGIFTCYINTPSAGFGTAPFKVNDEVFVEDVVQYDPVSTGGTGFNSADVGYRFAKVTAYTEAASGRSDSVTIDFAGLSTNTGIAVTNQGSVASLINKNNYPTFVTNLIPSSFNIGEKILSNDIERDLIITSSESDYIKVSGTYRLSVGERITGKDSGTISTINDIVENLGRFAVKYMVKKDIGWTDDIGSLNLDTQVTPNNDYYQNMSYTVQSTRTFDQLRSPVSSLLHTSGLKNFANTGVTSTSSIGIGSTDFSLSIQDIIEDNRVDTIYNYAFALDLGSGNSSNVIQLENKVLSSYTLAKSNEVLKIDNIKDKFSNLAAESVDYIDILEIDSNVSFKDILFRISNLDDTDVQITELVILNNGSNSILLEKSNLEDEGSLGSFSIESPTPGIGNGYLRFTPLPNSIDYDYNLKALNLDFLSSTGIGTQTVGFINITGSAGVATTSSTGITTTTIISVDSTEYNSLYVKTHLINQTTSQMNYIELYVTHDGTNTYVADSFVDTHSERDSYSETLMGEFKGNLTGSTLSLQYENTLSDEIKYRTNIVGFGSTSTGTDTYRFSSPNEPAGSERSLIYQSNYVVGVGTTTAVTLDKSLFNANTSIVEVSVGSTRAVHQLMMTHDTADVYIQPGPILSNAGDVEIDTRLGIGTFGAEYVSNDFVLKFYPDPEFITDNIQVSSLNKVFYTVVDFENASTTRDLTYGTAIESFNVYAFNAVNGNRINRKNFALKSNNTPIFAKRFNPADSTVIALNDNKFNIDKHFFRTDEELIYTPGSTFVGVGSTPMLYQSSTGAVDSLPSTVFAIRDTTDTFQISTTRGGNAVTVVGIGTGNDHQFEMSKSNTKSIITVDNVIQSPIAFVPLSYTLENNIDDASTGISTTRTIFSLSGISSITSADILKIDNEYMKVLNVGVGTTTVGPILGIGSTNLIEVERGFIGSGSTNHANSSTINLYRGSYNMVGEEIWFTDAPKGNPQLIKNNSNLNYPTADFAGRVYLRDDYDTNQVYDDISDQFTGIGETYTLTNIGVNTVGLGSTGGNGLLLISNIFQTPTAENNPSNNFDIQEDLSSGISSVRFTGIRTATDDPIIISDIDVNQNELPRGGLIISLGSTPGLGYAPAVGARAYLEKDSDGVITNVVGIATTGPAFSISTSSYDNETGVLIITTTEEHNFEAGIIDQVKLSGLAFTCPSGSGITTTIFPESPVGFGSTSIDYTILGIGSTNTFTTNVGVSTIPHYYNSGGSVMPWYGDATIGSGYTGSTISIGVTDVSYTHTFVSGISTTLYSTSWAGTALTASSASYNPSSGDLTLTVPSHGLTTSDNVGIRTNSLVFTCSKDDNATEHSYPRPTDPVAGIITAITSYDSDKLTVNVGASVGSGGQVTATVGAGGTLTFSIGAGGTNYINPYLDIPEASYTNLSVTGVSRLGIGATTETGVGLLLNAHVSGSSTIGAASTYFEINKWDIVREGYGFKKGDVFTPVGLVTDASLSSPISSFELTVLDTFNDSFAAWQFGQFDYIDSIQPYQDGSKKRFELRYDGELLSFQIDPGTSYEGVNLSNALLIFINGILQEPESAYLFAGGTSFVFTEPPKVEDKVSIFFYRGTAGSDTTLITNVYQTLKIGDDVQLDKILNSVPNQQTRVATAITSTNVLETNLYKGVGITTEQKSLNWTKQKVDKIINGEVVYKSRSTLEPLIFPTAKIIGDFSTTDTEIFVDNASFFDEEGSVTGSSPISGRIVDNTTTRVSAAITAIVSTAGTISSLNIVSGGSGYVGATTDLSIAAPFGVGIGTTTRDKYAEVGVSTFASGTATITNGSITDTTITNMGLGYTSTAAPNVLVSLPTFDSELIGNITSVKGFSGIVTGIGTTAGDGVPLALKFSLYASSYSDLNINYPIYISNTTVGTGVTSIFDSDSEVVGIGTTFLDNIYNINHIWSSGTAGIITCNIKSDTTVVGLSSTGSSMDAIGRFSWGRLQGSFTRSPDPVSLGVTGLTINSGLTTFPTIQRRVSGLRDTGALDPFYS